MSLASNGYLEVKELNQWVSVGGGGKQLVYRRVGWVS